MTELEFTLAMIYGLGSFILGMLIGRSIEKEKQEESK